MKVNCELKVSKKKNKNRKRPKKRRGNRKKFKYQKVRSTKHFMRYHFPTTMSGDCYWKNYTNVMQWQRNYLAFIPCNRVLENPRNKEVLLQRNGGSFESNASKRFPVQEHLTHTSYSEDTEDELEVTEEMMAFLEKSMRHKEAMRLKEESELVSPEKDNDTSRDNIEECQAPKEKMIDEKRIQEMTVLYGKASSMIMGMETALQLTFNRNCDVYKPSYWPCLPLNIKF